MDSRVTQSRLLGQRSDMFKAREWALDAKGKLRTEKFVAVPTITVV
jgi:hypothetical protein